MVCYIDMRSDERRVSQPDPWNVTQSLQSSLNLDDASAVGGDAMPLQDNRRAGSLPRQFAVTSHGKGNSKQRLSHAAKVQTATIV